MLSGNRNFEARVHPEVKANYLASPPLVVAYALAGRMDIDLTTEPLGHDPNGDAVYLSEIWPTPAEVQATIDERDRRGDVPRDLRRRLHGRRPWRELPVPEGELFAWEPSSTYVRRAAVLRRDGAASAGTVEDIVGARCLVSLGDSVTTDHISPAGSIKPDSPGRARTSSSTASSGRTSTPTARAAATTR